MGIESRKNLVISEVLSAIELIESNLTQPLSLEDISSRSKFSHWEFQRIFSAITTISVSRYQRQRRLSESLRKIKQSDSRIIDVAFEFQFNSSDAFTRAFKSYFNFLPSDWKKNEKNICSQKMNKMNVSDLEYYYDKIQRVPEIEYVEKNLLYGKETTFTSHFSDDSDCSNVVVPLWKKIYQDLKSHPYRVGDNLFGLAFSEDGGMDSLKMKYFASIGIEKSSSINSEYTEQVLPGGLYAKFEKKGLADKTSSIVNYIYGIWLPSSDYQRGEGPDFELFDKRYNLSDPNSLSYFLVPIKLSTK